MEVEVEKPSASSHSGTLSSDNSVDTNYFLRIVHIDVNQGESTLILYGTKDSIDYAAIIDGGRSSYAAHIQNTLKAYGVEKLNAIINTHFDTDHLEGLTELLRIGRANIDAAYDRGAPSGDDKPMNFRKQAGNKLQKMTRDFLVERKGNFVFRCLYATDEQCMSNKENDHSIIMEVRLGDFVYYTAGDQGHQMEYAYAPSKCTAFKCGHHGSKHSTSSELLKKLNASVAIISAGTHGYCHPHHEVLEILDTSKTINGIYLTNCSYNRPQVNSGYQKKEILLSQHYLNNIIKANIYPSAVNTLEYIQQTLNHNKAEAYISSIEELYQNIQSDHSIDDKFKVAIETARLAITIWKTEINRKEERLLKAWVCGNNRYLGNIEIQVGASGFVVSFISEATDRFESHYRDFHGNASSPFPRINEIAVPRTLTGSRIESFSMMTGRVIPDIEEIPLSQLEIAERELGSKQDHANEEMLERIKGKVCAHCGSRINFRNKGTTLNGNDVHVDCPIPSLCSGCGKLVSIVERKTHDDKYWHEKCV